MQTLALLDTMLAEGVTQFIFSSTAAVFGDPLETPMTEAHRRQPITPYRKSKLAVELALEDYARAYGLCSITFRYFNAAGAHPDGSLVNGMSPRRT